MVGFRSTIPGEQAGKDTVESVAKVGVTPVPLSIDIRTIARVQVVAWEDGEWGIVWETRDGQRGADRIGKRADAEAIVLAVIGGGLRPASAVTAKTPPRAIRASIKKFDIEPEHQGTPSGAPDRDG
jgi:hypothetical protein